MYSHQKLRVCLTSELHFQKCCLIHLQACALGWGCILSSLQGALGTSRSSEVILKINVLTFFNSRPVQMLSCWWWWRRWSQFALNADSEDMMRVLKESCRSTGYAGTGTILKKKASNFVIEWASGPPRCRQWGMGRSNVVCGGEELWSFPGRSMHWRRWSYPPCQTRRLRRPGWRHCLRCQNQGMSTFVTLADVKRMLRK